MRSSRWAEWLSGWTHKGLRRLSREDDDLVALRLLVDRRDKLSRLRVLILNRLHRLFAELIAGAGRRA